MATDDETTVEEEETPPVELLPSGCCAAACQFKGKGKFVDVQLQLGHDGKLVFKSVGSKKSGTVLREANVFGSKVENPKKPRKGHPHSLRLDTAHKDSKGDSKYILSMGSAALQLQWTEYLLAFADST